MKALSLMSLSLLLTAPAAYAAPRRSLGGILLHSSVGQRQASALKQDLSYLFQLKAPKADPVLGQLLGVTGQLTGPVLFNWLSNRLRLIVGEEFQLEVPNLIHRDSYSFPSTPIPDLPNSTSTKIDPFSANPGQLTSELSNIGGTLYLAGKTGKVLMGVALDGLNVYATSPRIGLLQVGHSYGEEGAGRASTILRLAKLFHEARHSDGTGKSTGFMHAACPDNHPMKGELTCDLSANGPATVEAQVIKFLADNCADCSAADLDRLQRQSAEAGAHVLKTETSGEVTDILGLMSVYRETRNTYQQMLAATTGERHRQLMEDIQRIDQRLAALVPRLEEARRAAANRGPLLWDVNPEGKFAKISLSDSNQSMQRTMRQTAP